MTATTFTQPVYGSRPISKGTAAFPDAVRFWLAPKVPPR